MHQITLLQGFDRHLTTVRQNAGAGHETGHRIDRDKARVRQAHIVFGGVGKADGFGVAIGHNRKRAVGVQRDLLTGGKGDGIPRNHRHAVDVGNGDDAGHAADVIGQNVDRCALARGDVYLVGYCDKGTLTAPRCNQDGRVKVAVGDVGDADANAVHLTRNDGDGDRHRDGEPVHFGVEIAVSVVDVQVLVVDVVHVANGRGFTGDLDRHQFAVDPDAHRIVENRVREFRIFLRREHELQRHHVAFGDEIHIQNGRIKRAGPGQLIEIGVVVHTAGIRAGVGILVCRIVAARSVCEIVRVARGQDHTRIRRRYPRRDRIPARINSRAIAVTRIACRNDGDTFAKDGFCHLLGGGAGVVVQICCVYHRAVLPQSARRTGHSPLCGSVFGLRDWARLFLWCPLPCLRYSLGYDCALLLSF